MSTVTRGKERSATAPVDLTGLDRLTWNVLTSWLGYLTFVAAGFIMPRFIDHHMGQTALGVWDFGWSVSSYLGLAPLGIGSAVNRYVASYRSAGDREGLRRAVSSVVFVQVVAATAAVGLSVLAAWWVSWLLGDRPEVPTSEARWVVLLLGFGVALQMAFDAFRGVMTGCHRWDLHNGLNSGFYAATVVAMMTSLSLGGGLRSLALTNLIGIFWTEVTRAGLAFRVCPELRLRWGYVSRKQIRLMLGYGIKTLTLHCSWLLLHQGNSILIATYLGPAALALYARPLGLIRHGTMVVSKYAHVLLPTSSGLQEAGGQAELRSLLQQSARFAAYLTFPMVLGLAIMGGPLLHVWMGPSYAQGLLLAVLAVGHLLPITQEPALNILAGMNLHGRVGVGHFFGALGGIGMGVVTIKYLNWGLLGAAFSLTLPSFIVFGLYVPYRLCKLLDLPVRRYFARALGGPVLCAIPFSVGLMISRIAFADQPLSVLIAGGGVGVLILAPLYWRHALPVKMRELVVRVMRDALQGVAVWSRGSPTRSGPRGLDEHGAVVLKPTWAMGPRVRAVARSLLDWSGVSWWWRFLHRHDVIIIGVHGVMEANGSTLWTPLRSQFSPRRLEECLRMLSKHYRFVSLDDALGMLAGRKPLQPYSMAFTMDDGYRNNITHALPILQRYGVPATLFLATGHVEQRKPFWFDRLDFAIQHGQVDGREVKVGNGAVRLEGTTRGALAGSFRALREAAKAVARHDTAMVREMEELAAQLEAESGRRLADIFERDDWSAILSWDDVRGVRGSDVSFGSHTVDHIRLGLVDPETIADQLVRSKAMMEAQTGRACQYLCYPDGSFSPQAVEIARLAGYEGAVTTVPGLNRVGDDPLTLRRMWLPTEGSMTKTLAEVSGFGGGIRRLITDVGSILSRLGLKRREPVIP